MPFAFIKSHVVRQNTRQFASDLRVVCHGLPLVAVIAGVNVNFRAKGQAYLASEPRDVAVTRFVEADEAETAHIKPAEIGFRKKPLQAIIFC